MANQLGMEAREAARPLKGRWTSRAVRPVGPDELIEVSVLMVPAGEWDHLPESNDPAWRPLRTGDSVVAVRIVC